MITPYADYSSFVVECSTNDLSTKLQRIQNRALRICKFKDMYAKTSVTELHTHFKIEKLSERRFHQLLSFMYKQANSKGLIINEDDRRTRNDGKIKFPPANYDYASTRKSPWYRGIWEWDGLTVTMQKAKTKNEFKTLTKLVKPRPHLV